MNNPIISIIVPVYNVEKYIERCINSILSQSFKQFELILVNDGSTDNSGKICDKYSQIYSNIKVFHRKNNGVNTARKLGVENACGNFIIFVDSDDELKNDALKQMYEYQQKYDADIIVTAKSRIKSNHKEINLKNKCDGHLSTNEYIICLLENKIFIGPHGRMTRRNLFYTSNAFNMPTEIVINEDLIMNLRLGLYANNIYVSNQLNTYNYYDNIGTASKNKKDLFYWNKVFLTINEILIQHKLNTSPDIKKAYCIFMLNRILTSTQKPDLIKEQLLSEVSKGNNIKDTEILKNYLLIRYHLLSIPIKIIFKIMNSIKILFKSKP